MLWLESCLNKDDSGSHVDEVEEHFLPQQNDIWESDNEIPLSSIWFFYRKNKYKWAKTAPNQALRTPAHNIANGQQISSEKDSFSISKKLIKNEILREILKRSNAKLIAVRSLYFNENRPELQNVDLPELLELNFLLGNVKK